MRLALRALLRTPGFTVTAVLSLALAIGASAAAFAVIDAVRFRALPFPDGDRLVLLSEVPIDEGGEARSAEGRGCRVACDVSYETFDQVLRRHRFRALDAVAGYSSGGKALATKGEPLLVTGGVISPNLLALLQVQPQLGRPFTADDDKVGAPPVTLLSHALWTSQFGADPGILGRVVKLSDTQYTVVGVMPPGFAHEVNSQFWLPVVPVLDPSTRPSIRTLTAIGRLAPGQTLAQLRAELSTLEPAPPAVVDAPGGGRGGVRAPAPRLRLTAAPLRERYAASTQSHDLVFGAVVGCILLIACANLANLVLVRTLHQQRELAIRAALGGAPGRVGGHLLRQHLLLVLFGGALGVVLAQGSLGALQSASVLDSLRPPGMEYRLDMRVIAFAIAVAALAAAIVGVVPARLVARLDPQRLLRDATPGASPSRWGRRLQQLFVMAQVASAVVLVSGGALLTKSVLHLSRVDLGFQAQRLVQGTPSFPHPWRVPATYHPVTERILRELQRLPGVANAAVRASVPLGARGTSPAITLDGMATPLPPGDVPTAAVAVSPEYFGTLDVAVVNGRAFTEDDREGTIAVAMVNEWAARRWWPGKNPVGQVVRVDTAPGLAQSLSIVGVVRDNKAAQPNVLLADDGAELYRPWRQASTPFPTFLVQGAAAPAPLLRPVRQLLVREVPDRPVFATLVADQVGDQLRGVRTNATQILAFAAVGLLLAVLGLHGVLAYSVGVRTREIGIRGALGASRQRIAAMILRDALLVCGGGVAAGLVVARSTTPLLAELLYGTHPSDPVAMAVVVVFVLLVALLASWLPARRASRVDPLDALRTS
ncbi:MAG: ABC transporter permease [Gemmatimonadetes bacterium]|nr:ABC transporter permease [Gemmatimonadota bacterium]